MRRLARSLRRDRRGATLVEFAIVAPVLCLLLIGAFDMGHTLYMKTVLQGVMQKSARDSGLESGLDNRETIDAKVEKQVKALANNAEITFKRRYYRTFSAAAAAKAEPFTDTNANGKCDAGEPFEDQNHNHVRDADGADDGQGGAKDSVLYTVTVEYPRMFPMNAMLGFSDTTTVTGAMILANQPYGDQGSYAAPTVRNCA
ncbi:pilus assembly protein [Sphingomonas gilva]|uniref:Pilus assembly protein n=1 Tax=Sphingomonas gilva TaxID=2305907 RepID=A0A396RLA4_9SPHN|nr:TadE/TadG family type IV pilus assembly protein [Sphingomonas gilva]RHW17070.1 pilus assembly protein [Sphingomonas gilva]